MSGPEKEKSIIYRNIHLYRIAMSFLYKGGYRRRFDDVTSLFNGGVNKVLELCFGDIYIAKHCRERGIEWLGFDSNREFVSYARARGHAAERRDIMREGPFPEADVCVMVGSLYHFHSQAEELIGKMVEAAGKVIISEPVINLSSGKGVIGRLAQNLSDTGRGKEAFRYNEGTFMELVSDCAAGHGFEYRVAEVNRDILVEITGTERAGP